jgi:plastocyanin
MTRPATGHPALAPVTSGILLAAILLNFPALQAATPSRSIPLTIGDYRFSPDTLTVSPGETNQLQLASSDSLTPHNFTLQAEAAGLDVDIATMAWKVSRS